MAQCTHTQVLQSQLEVAPSLRVGVVQQRIEADLQASQQAVQRLLQGAPRLDLLVLPEVAWMPWLGAGEDAAAVEPKVLQAVGDLARQQKCHVSLSVRQHRANRWLWINPDGEVVLHYDKIHLFSPLGEAERYDAGTLAVHGKVQVGGTEWKVGAAVCYDLRFPELFRILRAADTELVTIPSRWPIPRLQHWRLLLQARAVENQCWMVGCNAVGEDPVRKGLVYGGHSMVVGPDGVIAWEGGDEETLGVAEIERGDVASVRARLPVWEDRRLW